jgi:hypothetical protein
MTPVGFVPDEGLIKLVLFVVLKSHWASVVFWALAGVEKHSAKTRRKRARAVEFFMAMKSRRVFAPWFAELDFWKKFFMSGSIFLSQNAAEPLWPSLDEASDKAEMLARSLAWVSIFTQERGKALVLKQKI